MKLRAAVLAAAVAFAVATPVAVGAADEKPTAALTYRTDVQPGRARRVIAILADGTAPTGASVLVDETGRRAVTAIPLPGSDGRCAIDPMQTGLGTTRWCFALIDVQAGAKATGRLVGDRTIVTLSVEARHDWRNAALVTLAALLAALGLVFVSTRVVPVWLIRAQLWSLTRHDHAIVGFRQWAIDVADVRLSRSDTLARLRWAKRHGTKRIVAARAGLQAAVAASHLDGSPLLAEASAEAARTDVRIDDLLAVTGAVETPHAGNLLGVLAAADASYADFCDSATLLIERIVEPDARAEAKGLRAAGLRMHRDVLRPGNLEHYQRALEASLQAIIALVPGETDHAARVIAVGVTGEDSAAGDGRPELRPPHERLAALPVVAATATAVVVAAMLMVVASAVVLTGSYLPNHTFGSFADYATLATTALGSSSVAGVLAMVLLLRGPGDWYG